MDIVSTVTASLQQALGTELDDLARDCGLVVRQRKFTGQTLLRMLVLTLLCHIAPESLVRVFNRDPGVVAFGSEYLRIISWNFMASGIIFAGSSTLQGLGNTRPALAASAMRLLLFALPAYVLSNQPSFEMRHVWYLSVASVVIHMAILVWLVHRQFNERLATVPLAAGAAAPRS